MSDNNFSQQFFYESIITYIINDIITHCRTRYPFQRIRTFMIALSRLEIDWLQLVHPIAGYIVSVHRSLVELFATRAPDCR